MIYERDTLPDGTVYERYEGSPEEISKLKLLIDNDLMIVEKEGMNREEIAEFIGSFRV